MGEQGLAYFVAEAGYDVHYAGRKTGLLEQFAEGEGGDGGEFGRLPDYCAAGG